MSIGDLAVRTGVAVGTLRMWEQRHGFPMPRRLASGHRRYTVDDVDVVLDVVSRREAGVRLDVAIAQAVAARESSDPAPPASVYAELRRRHKHLAPLRIRKPTLIGLSWAIEDEFCARAERAHLFATFQRTRYYHAARPRWRELARVARSAFVLADFDRLKEGDGPSEIPLPDDSPLHQQWTVVCDSRELPAALTAWEIPGQEGAPERDRIFECLWTVDPRAVRDAARVCARAAQEAGSELAAPVLFELADDPPATAVDLATVTTLFNRVVAYVDGARAHR